jgi:hypothetical protein
LDVKLSLPYKRDPLYTLWEDKKYINLVIPSLSSIPALEVRLPSWSCRASWVQGNLVQALGQLSPLSRTKQVHDNRIVPNFIYIGAVTCELTVIPKNFT